jgi:phosphoglycolate phosphatase-like HAD superfamily hydrolase
MTKIDTIYLDMDGVLSDFMSMYREVNGDWKRDGEGKKSTAWNDFCVGGYFAKLKAWPGCTELIEFVETVRGNCNVEILTSTGGRYHHEQVEADKKTWCEEHGIFYKVNAVPGRWTKKDWARPTAILIDDTEDVIVDWNTAGGVGILHRTNDETFAILKKLLDI